MDTTPREGRMMEGARARLEPACERRLQRCRCWYSRLGTLKWYVHRRSSHLQVAGERDCCASFGCMRSMFEIMPTMIWVARLKGRGVPGAGDVGGSPPLVEVHVLPCGGGARIRAKVEATEGSSLLFSAFHGEKFMSSASVTPRTLVAANILPRNQSTHFCCQRQRWWAVHGRSLGPFPMHVSTFYEQRVRLRRRSEYPPPFLFTRLLPCFTPAGILNPTYLLSCSAGS